MDRFVDLIMKVEPELADRIMKAGKAEVVTRLADAKFEAFTKCPISVGGSGDSEALQSVLNAVRQAKLGEAQTVKSINRTLKAATKAMSTTTRQLSTLSADMKSTLAKVGSIGSTLSSVKSLSYLNAGIGLVNLGVEVAGIVYIGSRLNSVQKSVEKLSAQIGQIKSILTNEKLSEFQKLCLRFGSVSVRLKDRDQIERKEIEDLLIEMRAFISEMVRNMYYDAIDTEILLVIIFNLLSAYTALLNIYVRDYFFEKGRLPENVDAYSSLFKELLDDSFTKMVSDFLVLKKGMGIEGMIDAIHTQKMLIMNCMLQFEDQVDIVELTETKDKYLSLIREANNYVKEEIETIIPEVQDENNTQIRRDEIKEALGAYVAAVAT